MSERPGKPKNTVWHSLRRVGELAALTTVAALGKLLSLFGPVGQNLRAWALERRDGLR